MTWVYSQSDGSLHLNDILVGIGYAGAGEGLNNPKDESIPNGGPIPKGFYNIGPSFTHPEAGPITMRLKPTAETNTFGRDGFLMHGDNMSLNHTASHGCIIMNRTVRSTVAVSSDRLLQVVD